MRRLRAFPPSRRTLVGLLVAALTLAVLATPAMAIPRMVGARGDPASDSGHSGMRAYIRALPVPQDRVDDSMVTAWIGTFFDDGSFYQSGTITGHTWCEAGNAWFAVGFDGVGNLTVKTTGACGDNVNRLYTSEYYGAHPNGTHDWLSYLNSATMPGSRFNTSSDTTRAPYAITETNINGSAPPSLRNKFGPAVFTTAIELRQNGRYRPATAGLFYQEHAPCGPYNIFIPRKNAMDAGKDVPNGSCRQDGELLWQR